MKWVTRRYIRVNRTASAWFIRRFVDPSAEFFFVAEDQVSMMQETRGAIGFDASGARYPHRDESGRCAFEMLVQEYSPDDEALRELGLIVRSADFADQTNLTPEGPGLRAISQGFPLVSAHDHDTLDRASFLYDALYMVIQKRLEIAKVEGRATEPSWPEMRPRKA